jgi:hypothetical protein
MNATSYQKNDCAIGSGVICFLLHTRIFGSAGDQA